MKDRDEKKNESTGLMSSSHIVTLTHLSNTGPCHLQVHFRVQGPGSEQSSEGRLPVSNNVLDPALTQDGKVVYF